MTVANTNVSSSYNCNGVTREFNIGFHYNSTLSGLSIVVLHADGTSTTVSANYEIEDNVLTYPTLESELDPLPEGDIITISRVTPLTQSINLVQQGPLDAEVLEGGYDKSTLQIQEVASKKQDKLIAGDNIVITEDGKISASGQVSGNVNWGNILGTLSNQTDLQTALTDLLAALNAKADSSDLSTVATSGSYTDLINQPSIPTDTEDLTNGAGYQTASDVSNAITSGITGKADKDLSNVSNTSGFRRLVEVSDPSILPSWYKVFDEYDPATGAFVGKWCEQGGIGQYNHQASIALLKSFADTNYSVQATLQPASYSYAYISAYDKSVSDFKVSIVQGTSGTSGIVCWEAKGYLPTGD